MAFFSKQKQSLKKNKSESPFDEAKSWADDRFSQNERSRARYQAAFLTSMGLNVAALLAITSLASMKTLVPMLVHHYDNGVTTVEAIKKSAPLNRAQIESDIVRYVTNREAFELSSYRAQFDLVTLLSSEKVAKAYAREHKASNKYSPIKLLGNQFSRRVHVYNINFLDSLLDNEKEIKNKKNHNNLASVVFTVTDVDKETGRSHSQSYSALLSWGYNQPSDSPELRWKNWDGFEVTRYTKQLRNDKA